MLYLLFFLAVLFSSSGCWVLRVSDYIVAKKITTNINMECVYDGNNNGQPKLNEIFEIRILKFMNNSRWDTIDRVSTLHPVTTQPLINDKEVKSNIGNLSNSYLKIKFPTATTETVGTFRCDIGGFNELVHTDPVVIKERSVNFDDILNIIEDMKKDENNNHNKIILLKDSIYLLKAKQQSVGNAIDRNANKISSLSEEQQQIKTSVSDMTIISTKLTNQINSVTKDILELKNEVAKQNYTIDDKKSIFKYDSSKVWPAGTYGILKPKTDCPYSPLFNWVKGSVKISTDKRDGNTDAITVRSHLAGPVIQHDDLTGYNSVNMELCVKTKQDKGPAWPAGHYCIQSYSGRSNEVSNFNSGYIEINRYSAGFNDKVVNTWSYTSNHMTRIGFWCRQDGEASTPIVLPSKDPFYLYRFGGKCQAVKEMDVTDEWVYFDTMLKDLYENTWHPDGRLAPVQIQLCYYKPRL